MDPLTFLRLFRASLLVQLRETFAQSTLHGVRFITEQGRPFWEKFCWFCMVSISSVTTLIIIFNLWQRFQTKPTITGPDTGFQHNWTTFPTVLVCPTDVVDAARAEKIVQLIDPLVNYTEIEPTVNALAGISYRQIVTSEDVGLLNVVKNIRNFVYYVAIGCEDLLSNCWFRGMELDCCSQFKSVFSEFGFCYGFNAKFYDTMPQWERTTEFNNLYETDKRWGLSFKPSRPSHIFIHSYDEISGLEFHPYAQWEDDFAIGILISKKETYTTEDARQLSIWQRKCIFPDEVKLKYYRDGYTFSGCMKECRIRKCLKFCKCVPPFYAPPNSLAFCTITQLACLVKYTANITSSKGCKNCELACHNKVYDVEKYSKTTNVTNDEVVTIEFLTWPLIRYKREVLFGWVDLLVSFGGIAGLFLGFSLLSGVEIIYFFTMRACCMLYKNR
ncbi:AAEL014010-PA, partial [Aedes aegypti]